MAPTLPAAVSSKIDAECTQAPTTPPPTTPPVSSNTGTYFRLTSLGNANNRYWCMGEIEFLDAAGTRFGTPGASYDGSSTSETPTGNRGYSPSKAFNGGSTGDDSCSSQWTTNTGWISIKLASAITVASITMRPDVLNDCPTDLKWESSSDGTTWTTMLARQTHNWTGPYSFNV